MARAKLLRRHIRQRFIVTLKTGQTFDGLVDEWDAAHLTLVNAVIVAQDQSARTYPAPVDGKVWLPQDQIAYMQQPVGASP